MNYDDSLDVALMLANALQDLTEVCKLMLRNFDGAAGYVTCCMLENNLLDTEWPDFNRREITDRLESVMMRLDSIREALDG